MTHMRGGYRTIGDTTYIEPGPYDVTHEGYRFTGWRWLRFNTIPPELMGSPEVPSLCSRAGMGQPVRLP